MEIINFLLLICVLRFSDGFLLNTKNTTSTGKQLYLTVSEYYGDKNQMHRDLEKLHQEMESQHQQQEVYRDQQEKTLQLLTAQLQQRFDAMEQKITGKNETQQEALDSLLQKYQELEQKYSDLKKTQDVREQAYQGLEQKYTTLKKVQVQQEQLYHELEQNYTQIHKAFESKNMMCTLEVSSLTNKTLTLEHKIDGLEQLKNVNQLKDFHSLQQKVQSFDSRLNLLSNHEQARNQDFLALYNITTNEINGLNFRFDLLERNHNKTITLLQKAEYQTIDTLNKSMAALQNAENYKIDNFTSVTWNKINSLKNSTSEKLDLLAKNLTMAVSELQRNTEKVVLTSCRHNQVSYSTGSVIKFPTIITVIGISNPYSFTTTGKFTCQVPGVYHISTVIVGLETNLEIDIMKNNLKIHHQYINGYSHQVGHWRPGATVVAVELKTNDTVWIQYASPTNTINNSCFTIFKI